MEEQVLQKKQSTAPAQVDCWFLSDPFRMNMVYEQLTSMGYTYVVGMDVGAGESMAYIVIKRKVQTQKDDLFKAIPLALDSRGNPKMPSMLCFTDDGVIIGSEVTKYPGFVQNFKRSPKKWGAKYNSQYTYRDLMKAFISQLWKQLLKYADEDLKKAFQEQKVLLTVGCPASREWTDSAAMKDYQELLKEATGSKHVAVLPESTAAIMSAILKPEKEDVEVTENEPASTEKINFEEGIAILDAGSSTIDFTFVLLGKVLITRSCSIGGHKLDEMMLQTALEDSGMTDAQIPEEQKPDILVQLREAKEEFYPKQISLGRKSIDIWGRNQDGEIDRDAPPSSQLRFAMNQEFMERVMNKKYQRQGVLGSETSETSWIAACKEFIMQTKNQIGNYPCGKVVITGGTSQVVQWKRAVEEAYPGLVVPSQNPASSVARGLCCAKSLEMYGRDYVESFQKSILKKAKPGYRKFARELASYMASIACDEVQNATMNLAQFKTSPTVSDLKDYVNANIQKNAALTGNAWKDKVCELFIQAFQSIQAGIYQEVNETSKEIYTSTILSTPVTLTATDRNIIGNMNIAVLTNAPWIAKVLPTTLYSFVSSVLSNVIWAFGPMNNEKFDKWRQRTFSRDRERLSKNQLIKIAADLKTNRASIVSKVSKKIEKKLREDGIGEKEFQSYVQRQAEIALGKVLFLVFDEQPR